jgi:hypothetical protein
MQAEICACGTFRIWKLCANAARFQQQDGEDPGYKISLARGQFHLIFFPFAYRESFVTNLLQTKQPCRRIGTATNVF